VNLGSRALFAPIARSFNATATVAFANSATAIGGRPLRISIFARRAAATTPKQIDFFR
jgi:hypothetical protein